MNKHRISAALCTLWVSILLPLPIIAREYSIYTSIYLSELTAARQPHIIGDNIVFSYYQQERAPRVVAVAFAHQNYTRQYLMLKNEHGVFLVTIPIASIADDIIELQYLYIIDGIWSHDNSNQADGYDFAGKRYSTTLLPRTGRPQQSPRIKERRVVFTFDPNNDDIVYISQINGSAYYFDPDQYHTVSIAGSFNGWDPFVQPLQHITHADGSYYQVTLTLPRGEHRYYFVVDGIPILDPLNDAIARETSGRQTSFFSIE